MRIVQVLTVVGFVVGLAVFSTGCSPGEPSSTETGQTTVPPPPPPIPPTPSVDSYPAQAPVQGPVSPPIQAQSPATPAPAPSVAPVDAAPENLVANASFARWDEGQYVPRHWTMGYGFELEDMPFELEPLEDPLYNEGHAVRQTWKASDAAQSLEKVFGQTIDGLDPNAGYRLDVVAHNESENVVIISAFEMEDFEPGHVGSGKSSERLNLEAAVITPGTGLVTYTGSFITNDSGTVKLGARMRGEESDFPASVIWDSWTLTRVN
jgi:hypothetical protein